MVIAKYRCSAGGRFDQEVVELVFSFTTSELLVVELSLGRQRTRWPQIRVSAVVVTPERSQVAPQRGLVRPDESGTQVNTVVGVYLFMYSGEHRCWCLFVLVRACHLLWCGA
jgi:hypothetical protein